MKITRISTYQVSLPRDRVYRLSGGRTVSAFESTHVLMETDSGLTGVGEVCPFGSIYLPAYPAGTHTGIAEIAPHLLGADPTQLEVINQRMDMALKGHPYAKSALDMACWDLLGQATGLSVCDLLGGRFGDSVALYHPIPHDAPATMAESVAAARAEGFRRFQPKIGGAPEDDIARVRAMAEVLEPGDLAACDANGGWLAHEAARVVRGVADLDIMIEQPCATYEACLTVRRRTDLPFILDEVIDSVQMLLRAHGDGAMDGVNIKIAKLGGLTRARQMRDLGVSLGLLMTLEDSGGGDVAAAAVAHFLHSTPEKYRFGGACAYFKVKLHTADVAPVLEEGHVRAPDRPGLGVTAKVELLGEAVVDVKA